MPTVTPPGAPDPRSALGYDGTNFYVLKVDSDGHLQIDALSSALPSGAATETTLGAVKDRLGALTSPAAGSVNKLLTDALTALQLIDNLQAALHSVNTDELVVRGEDQLFSLKDNYLEQVLELNASATADGLNGTAVPEGEWWIVNSIHAYDIDTVVTRIEIGVRRNSTTYVVNTIFPTVTREPATFTGHLVLKEGDFVRAYFMGTVLNDDLSLNIVGYKMTVEA